MVHWIFDRCFNLAQERLHAVLRTEYWVGIKKIILASLRPLDLSVYFILPEIRSDVDVFRNIINWMSVSRNKELLQF